MTTVALPRTYTFQSSTYLFRDTPERIDYHAKAGDYIALLATMMGFMEEAIMSTGSDEESSKKRDIARTLAQELRQDLRYLHANYRLVPRTHHDREQIRSGNVFSK